MAHEQAAPSTDGNPTILTLDDMCQCGRLLGDGSKGLFPALVLTQAFLLRASRQLCADYSDQRHEEHKAIGDVMPGIHEAIAPILS